MRRTHPEDDLNVLAAALAEHQPQAIYYIATGGRKLGQALAQRLGLPARPLDICYPLSRPLRFLPRPVSAALWPFKEVVYKLTSPRSRATLSHPLTSAPIVLVDDSASSGKTLSLALEILSNAKIPKSRVIRVVGRCGRRARDFVDYCLNDLS